MRHPTAVRVVILALAVSTAFAHVAGQAPRLAVRIEAGSPPGAPVAIQPPLANAQGDVLLRVRNLGTKNVIAITVTTIIESRERTRPVALTSSETPVSIAPGATVDVPFTWDRMAMQQAGAQIADPSVITIAVSKARHDDSSEWAFDLVRSATDGRAALGLPAQVEPAQPPAGRAPVQPAQAPGPQALAPASRPRDVLFRMRMIDSTWCETVAVADFNGDKRPDLIACEYWYEAPAWTPHKIREINFNGTYVDNFSDLPLDVDGDGYVDVIQIAYFERRILWLRNPGKKGGAWSEEDIDRIGPTEFAFLVDLDNDGKAQELLPQFTGAAASATQWYALENGKWVKHVVGAQSFGHGIGVGDVNRDGRNDILTPVGWLEAPPNPVAEGTWTLHETDWSQLRVAVGPAAVAPPGPPAPSGAGATAAPQRPAEFGFMYVLDVNGDGRNDVVTTMAHSYGVLWFEQLADGRWMQRMIDNTWAQAHASALADLNGDGQPDLITGKRYWARSAASDASEREPLGLYWYEFRRRLPAAAASGLPPGGSIEWVRHIIDYGGRAGGGLQLRVADLDGDGDLDVVSGGKSGLFLAENLTKTPASGVRR